MATQYAWSPINAGDKSLNYGDEATAAGLGISKEDFQALVDARSVRDKKPPKLPEGWQGSVVEFLRNEAREAELAAGADIEAANLEAYQAVGEIG